MWKDTTQERANRYKKILKDDSFLYAAATEVTHPAEDRLLPEEADNVCRMVLAPALHAYVIWVLRQAVVTKKKRLYFLARDAYYMYRTAVRLCEAYALPVECRYLSCSRYAVRIPLYHLNTDEAMEYICRGGIDVTPDKILSRAGLTEEEKDAVLTELQAGGSFPYQKDSLIPYAKLAGIRSVLKGSRSFMEAMLRHSEAALPALLGYLRQEGLTDEVPKAFVDSGWVGSMQKVLNIAIAYAGQADGTPAAGPVEGYYWGLYEIPSGADRYTYHCYYFSPEGDIRQKVYFSNCLFESVFSAPHGMTLGYRAAGERFAPVYGEITGEQECFLKALEARFSSFTESMITSLAGKGRAFEQLSVEREMITQLLSLFMAKPSAAEADYFGSLHFSDDVIDHGGENLANDLTEAELAANHALRKIIAMLGIRKGFVRESAWYEGSAVRGGGHVRRHLKGYARYKKLLYRRKK